MVDWTAHGKAHKCETCPACGGKMELSASSDIYKCESCPHFSQDPDLQDIVEQDDPVNLKFCRCEYCLRQSSVIK